MSGPTYRAEPTADGGALIVRERSGCAPIVECECMSMAAAFSALREFNGPQAATVQRIARAFDDADAREPAALLAD